MLFNQYEERDSDGCYVHSNGETYWFEDPDDFKVFIRVEKIKRLKEKINGELHKK